jgi:hypothetical protein
VSDQQPRGSFGLMSPDGRWRWDGQQWQPVSTAPVVPTVQAKQKRNPMSESIILLILGVIDTSVFPFLVPWAFFLLGLVQAQRASGYASGGKRRALLAFNGFGLLGYLGMCVVAAFVQGSPSWFVTYLLVSPNFLRLFGYLH